LRCVGVFFCFKRTDHRAAVTGNRPDGKVVRAVEKAALNEAQ
jgi:hypothetical protein